MTEIPLYSAPMAGISDKPFRHMVRQFGHHTLFTEMIGVESLMRGNATTCRIMDILNEKNIVVQLVGVSEKAMVFAAQAAEAAGAIGVDINMGCPVKKLISNGSGAALMKNRLTACRLVQSMASVVSVPVSVKIRAGWDNASLNAAAFGIDLMNAGAQQIEIHGRSKADGYTGPVHYDIIRALKQAVSVPVIANGDVTDKASATHMIQRTGADGVMIGRGLLGRPWILSEIDSGKRPDFCLSELVQQHIALLLSHYGSVGFYVARKHLAWYGQGRLGLANFLKNVYAVTTERALMTLINDFFTEQPLCQGEK